MVNNDRLKLVNELVNIPKNLEKIEKELSKFDWDYEGEKIILNSKKLEKIFLLNIKNYNFLTKWANLIELRDDIEYEDGKIENISEIIYLLSTPDINGKLDEKTFYEIIKKLPTNN